MKKILFLYSAKGRGGIGRNLSIITKGIDREKYSISVILIGSKEDRDADFRNLEDTSNFSHLDWHLLDDEENSLRSIFVKLRRKIEEIKPEILSCHGYKSNILGGLLRLIYLRKSETKLVSIAHGWVTPGIKLKLYYFLEKLCLNIFDKIIMVGSFQEEELRRFFIQKEKLILINNGIDVENFRAQKTMSLRERLNIKKSERVISFVGRLSKEKNIESLIKAFYLLKKKKQNVLLVIAGEGEERGNLERLVEDYNLSSSVILLGQTEDVLSVYQASDLYCSLSKKEGLPNNVLEAMACLVPCILSNISAHKEIAKNEESAILLRPCEVEQISTNMLQILEDKERSNRLANNALTVIKGRFSVKERVKKLESVYNALS